MDIKSKCACIGQQMGNGDLASRYLQHQPSSHCIVSIFFLLWAVGDCGRQVGKGRWASKHLENHPYQKVACWLIPWKKISVQFFSSLCAKIEIIVEWIGCVDRKRTNVGLVSNYCPLFLSSLCAKIEIIVEWIGCVDRKRTNFRPVSHYCPNFCPAYAQKKR